MANYRREKQGVCLHGMGIILGARVLQSVKGSGITSSKPRLQLVCNKTGKWKIISLLAVGKMGKRTARSEL